MISLSNFDDLARKDNSVKKIYDKYKVRNYSEFKNRSKDEIRNIKNDMESVRRVFEKSESILYKVKSDIRNIPLDGSYDIASKVREFEKLAEELYDYAKKAGNVTQNIERSL